MDKLAIVKAVTGCGDRDLNNVDKMPYSMRCSHAKFDYRSYQADNAVCRESDFDIEDTTPSVIKVLYKGEPVNIAMVAECSCGKVYVEVLDD